MFDASFLQYENQGLNILEAKGGRRVTFRDLLGLHDVWKGYAARLVSQCGSNERLVQQRVLAADLQVSALLHWLTASARHVTVEVDYFVF